MDKENVNEKSPLTVKEETRPVSIKMFLLGTTGAFLSHVIQGLSAAGVQILDGAMPSFELNLWRVSPMVVYLLPYLLWKRMNLHIPRRKIPVLLLLIFGFNGQMMSYYYAAQHVALGTLSAMQVGIAIMFNAILSICFRAERSAFLYMGAVLSVIGLMLMAQPTFLGFDHSSVHIPLNWTSPCIHPELHNTTESLTTSAPTVGYISPLSAVLIVVSAAGIVCQAHCNKSLLGEGIPSLVISWWTALGGILPSIILMLSFEQPVILTSPFCGLLVALHCLGVQQSVIIVPWSLLYILPGIVAMSYATQMIAQLICQYTFLRNIQPGFGNWQEVFGAALCTLGILAGPLGHMVTEKITESKAKRIDGTMCAK